MKTLLHWWWLIAVSVMTFAGSQLCFIQQQSYRLVLCKNSKWDHIWVKVYLVDGLIRFSHHTPEETLTQSGTYWTTHSVLYMQFLPPPPTNTRREEDAGKQDDDKESHIIGRRRKSVKIRRDAKDTDPTCWWQNKPLVTWCAYDSW